MQQQHSSGATGQRLQHSSRPSHPRSAPVHPSAAHPAEARLSGVSLSKAQPSGARGSRPSGSRPSGSRPSGPGFSPRQRKQRRVIAVIILVLFIIGVIIAVTAIIVNIAKRVQAPSEPVVSVSASSKPAVSASASTPEKKAPEVPPVTDEFGLAGLPPLFNYENYIPDDYVLDLVDVGGGQSMQKNAATAFLAMCETARDDGVTLAPVSGYRSNEHQTTNYNTSIQRYRDQGYSEDEALAMTQAYYAIPGTSEHEAGLAMDIGLVDDSFASTAAYDWLQEHCIEFGFINRYRKDTKNITHIAWEPWHYRFVGSNHAKEIEKRGITLEEYIESFDPADGSSAGGRSAALPEGVTPANAAPPG